MQSPARYQRETCTTILNHRETINKPGNKMQEKLMSGKQGGKKSLETEKNCIMSLNNENLILNIYGLNKT